MGRKSMSVMNVFRIAFVATIVGLCLVCVTLLYVMGKPPSSASHLPIYTGATSLTDTGTEGNLREIGFITSDSLASVLQFYEGVLLKDGWSIGYNSPQSALYEWVSSITGAMYSIKIDGVEKPGSTKVTVSIQSP
jgi:hypothetical protein